MAFFVLASAAAGAGVDAADLGFVAPDGFAQAAQGNRWQLDRRQLVEGGPQGGFAGDVVDEAAAGVLQRGEAAGGAALDVGLDVGGGGVAAVHQAGGEPFADQGQVLDGAQVGEADDEQVEELERIGVDAVLIGESLMRSGDPEAAVRALVSDEEMTREHLFTDER